MKMRDVALAASWQDIVSSVRCRCELFHKLVVSYSYCDALIITAQAHKASNKWHENHLCGLFRQHDLPTLKSAVCVCECVCLMVSCCNCFSLLLLSWNDFALSLTPPSPVSLSLSLSVTVAGLCETYRCSIDFFQHANTGTAAVALVEFRPGDRRRRKLCHLHGKLRNSDQVSRLWASDGQRETDYASVVVPGNVLRCFPRAELQCLSLLILWSVCDGVITECVCVSDQRSELKCVYQLMSRPFRASLLVSISRGRPVCCQYWYIGWYLTFFNYWHRPLSFSICR